MHFPASVKNLKNNSFAVVYICSCSLKNKNVVIKDVGVIPSRAKKNIPSEVRKMFEDKTLVCKDCGEEFVFTAREQEFYESKGFVNEPQRCKPCRDKRKNAGKAPREMHEAVCAACGGVAKVPFMPRDDRPVYCSECFAKMKEESAE